MIIDFHTHTYPDNIAKKATDDLSKMSDFIPFADGSERSLIEELKKGVVNTAVVLSVAVKENNVESINRYNISKRIENIFFLGAMHPDYKNFDCELDFLLENKIYGLKLHPEFQDFKPNDKKLFPLYEKAIKNDMFIVFHAGKEEFLKRSTPNGHPKLFAEVHDLFPELKMILAHCGGHFMENEVEEFLLGKDIYLDLAFDLPYVSSKYIKTFFKKHSSNFILYGSDFPWQPLNDYFKLFDSIHLNSNTKDKVTFLNAKNLLKL